MVGVPRGVRRAGLAALLLAVTLTAPLEEGKAEEGGTGTTDRASAKQAVDQERRRLARRYDETLALEADRLAAYEQSLRTAQQLAAEVTRLDQSLSAITQDLERAGARLADALEAEARVHHRLDVAKAELRRRLQELKLSAVVAYVE